MEVCLIHEMSYSFAIHSTTFLVKLLSVDEFLISDGIVYHITRPEYERAYIRFQPFGDIKKF